jgi:hypothetical protein
VLGTRAETRGRRGRISISLGEKTFEGPSYIFSEYRRVMLCFIQSHRTNSDDN